MDIDEEYFDINQRRTKHYVTQFTKVAGNEHGSINVDGLGKLVKNLNGVTMPKEELQALMNEIDLDGNNSLEFDEFVCAMQRLEDKEEDLKDVFIALDKNSNCYIMPETIRHVMMSLGESVSIKELQEIICEFDSSGEGKLNFNDFKHFFRGNNKVNNAK